MAALASDWLIHFSTSPLNPLNGIHQNLTGSKIATPFTKFVFFWPIRKTRWPPWPLIGWDSFVLLLWKCWMEFNKTWQEARSQRPLTCLYYSGQSLNKNGRSGRFLEKGGTLYSGARYVALWASCLCVHCSQVSDSGLLGLLFLLSAIVLGQNF